MDIYLLILEIVFVIFCLVYTFYLYKVEKNFDNRKKEFNQSIEKRLEQARKNAEEIIQSSEQKSKKILENTKVFKSTMETEAQSAMDETYKKYIFTIEQSSKEISNEYSNLFQKLKDELLEEEEAGIKSIKQSAQNTVTGIGETITKDLEQSHKELQDEIKLSFEQANKEIESYKQQKIKELDQYIFTTANKLSLKVLGKSLDENDHKKIILDTLEEAKKEGVFQYE